MRDMKDSGIEWAGEIPKKWEVVRIGLLFSFESGNTLTSESIEPYGKYKVYGANGIRGYYNQSNLSGKHILIGRVGALCGNIHIVDEDVWVTEHALIAYNLRNQIDEYFGYVFEAMNLIQFSKASAQPVIASGTISQKLIPIPSIVEQRRIALFLDSKCKQVDTLIANVQAQSEKLKAYKQSLITEVVAKGIEASASMKDSGIDYIGEINAEYDIVTIGSLFRLKKDILGKEPEQVLSITQNGIRIKDTESNKGQNAASYAHYQIVNVGDFAMNHMDLLTGWIDVSLYEGVTSPDYRVFAIKDKTMNPYYFLKVFQAYYKNKTFYGFGQGVANLGRWRLPAGNWSKIQIPVPPIEEQNKIVEYLDKQCAQIDQLIAIKEKKIDKLNEYKKSLIYEYVTGKKEA